ncbi:MAG: precorrin-6A reductase [Chloroflexi bacterium]|nr:precorrin-6A reductase [Chloroflexota bacterium]
MKSHAGQEPRSAISGPRVLVISGTREGREISALLSGEGYVPLTSTVTDYGAQLVRESCSDAEIYVGALEAQQMAHLCQERRVDLVIDASHPYAVQVTRNAATTCRKAKIPYLRYDRPTIALDHPLIYPVLDYREAAEKAVKLAGGQGAVFSTIGANRLAPLVEIARAASVRLVVRVLPQVESLERCLRLGIQPREIVALQGPFSYELNKILLRDYQAAALVTKDGGSVGGADTKIKASLDLKVPVVLIARPAPAGGEAVASYGDLLARVKKSLSEVMSLG